MNRVTTWGSAIIDGKGTGLAGCSDAICERDCLRRDPLLKKEQNLKRLVKGAGCKHFIPTVEMNKNAES